MGKMRFDNNFLLPVEVEICQDGILLKAQNEQVRFRGDLFSANCNVPLNHCVTVTNDSVLSVTCHADQPGRIEDYFYFDGTWEGVQEIVVAKTKLTGIGAFLRTASVSFFLSLDFPYSRITAEDNRVTIGCDPQDLIQPDQAYVPHTLTIGAASLSGHCVGNFDRGEIEAFSEYILSRMPVHFRGERPIFSSTCITNRMTDVREGRIFYSMYDNPTLTLDPETLKEEVRLCSELGIEYYQLFEGYYDWEEDGSSEQALREIVELGRSLGVRVGDYMTPLELNCWHYNYYDRTVPDPSMCALEEDGQRRYLCYGDDRVIDYLMDTVVASIHRNKEEMICLDGDAAVICHDPSHGHTPGSLYAHVRGLVRIMEAMNAASPYFLTWSNSGNWLELMPKLVWYNQNVYLTDPHPRAYSSSLNNLKYYADCRREQMVTVHNQYFVPYCLFTNCEYYAFRHSRVDDAAFFEYSFLQGLAVTPNICLGELRTFLERTPSGRLEYVKGFMKKWLSFIRENIDCWKNVYQLNDAPGVGANEAYAHMNGDHGFLCLVNQNNYSQSFSFVLDGTIGLKGSADDRFLLTEIYPSEHPLAEQPLPGPLYGTQMTLSVPAHSVRFIKISPYTPAPEGIRLYGAAGKMTKAAQSACFSISAESGRCIPMALWLEQGNSITQIAAETVWTVPKYYFPTTVDIDAVGGCGGRFKLKMPRDAFERELSHWHIERSEQAYCLKADCSDFLGAYVHNLYKEDQHTHLTVSWSDDLSALCPQELAFPLSPESQLPPSPHRRATAYETQLSIPFIEWPAMGNLYGLDEIIELAFIDSGAVAAVRAFLDDVSVPVREYVYPSEPTMKGFYIELTGQVTSGSCPTLRVEVDWQENRREKAKPASTQGTAHVIGQG